MSTSATSNIHLDRKSLRRPDGFFSMVSSFFDAASKNTRAMGILLGALLAIGIVAAFIQNRNAAQADLARSELYLARKSVEKELIAFASTDPEWKAQAAKSKEERKKAAEKNKAKDAKGAAKKDEALEEEKPTAEAVAFRKLDVDAKVPTGVKNLTTVTQKFSGTRAAFEARLALGDLYYQHGQSVKSLPFYEEASKSSPSTFDRALAYYSLGYAYESAAKLPEAQQAFDRALSMGETGLRGELLLSIARIQEARGQKDEAKKTYDRVISELPSSEYSRSAEMLRTEIR